MLNLQQKFRELLGRTPNMSSHAEGLSFLPDIVSRIEAIDISKDAPKIVNELSKTINEATSITATELRNKYHYNDALRSQLLCTLRYENTQAYQLLIDKIEQWEKLPNPKIFVETTMFTDDFTELQLCMSQLEETLENSIAMREARNQWDYREPKTGPSRPLDNTIQNIKKAEMLVKKISAVNEFWTVYKRVLEANPKNRFKFRVPVDTFDEILSTAEDITDISAIINEFNQIISTLKTEINTFLNQPEQQLHPATTGKLIDKLRTDSESLHNKINTLVRERDEMQDDALRENYLEENDNSKQTQTAHQAALLIAGAAAYPTIEGQQHQGDTRHTNTLHNALEKFIAMFRLVASSISLFKKPSKNEGKKQKKQEQKGENQKTFLEKQAEKACPTNTFLESQAMLFRPENHSRGETGQTEIIASAAHTPANVDHRI